MTYNRGAIDDIQRFALITYRARRGGHTIPEGLIGDGGSFRRKEYERPVPYLRLDGTHIQASGGASPSPTILW